MKIDVSSIIADHVRTLRHADTGRTSLADLILFYGVPIAAALAAYGLEFRVRLDAYNASITFYGIFIALLLNIQIGMFAVFQRKWDKSSDIRVTQAQHGVRQDKVNLLTELNANLSYLVVISCISVSLVLLFYVFEKLDGVAPAVVILLYLHFLLTLLMVVKRAHALFHKEYRDAAG